MNRLLNKTNLTWIFDLDNTLYPDECNLFAQIDERMGRFVAQLLDVDPIKARRIQKDYYHRYGTTLNGLMAEHVLDPHYYLEFVHDIDHSILPKLPELREAIHQLEGAKYIFTNGSRKHAELVAEKLGILDEFNDVFDIVDAQFIPKPKATAYDIFVRRHGVNPPDAIMFEDLHINLQVPYMLGMSTVLVKTSSMDHPGKRDQQAWTKKPDHVHFETKNLTEFLTSFISQKSSFINVQNS